MTSIQGLLGGPRQNIEYGKAGEASLFMDAHLPEAPGPHPAVIVVHGGAWVRGDRQRSVEPLLKTLTEAGFAWFTVSYRFATDAMLLGTAIDDVQAAIQYVRKHAGEFDVDADRIALVGESAGAQLASMAAIRERSVKGVVALYSPSDLVSLAQTSPLVPEVVRQAISGTVWAELALQALRSLSPAEHVSKDMPPHLLIHGTADSVVPFNQSEAMCKRMESAGAACELYAVKGAGHGIRFWENSREFTAYKSKMVAWLRERLTA